MEAVSSPPDPVSAKDYTLTKPPDHAQQRIWEHVSRSPLHSLWDLQGIPLKAVAKRTWTAFNDDNVLGRSAELGYYFLFALFPTLVSASAILGLVARHASDIYERLLHYLALVVPPSAFGIVLETFNQTTAASTSGKVTFGLAAALYAASVGFSAIQDGLNAVYKVKETRPFWKARGAAMIITTLLSLLVTAMLACLLLGDYLVHLIHAHNPPWHMAIAGVVAARVFSWLLAIALLALLFSLTYYFGPDVKKNKWRWLTPGGAVGIFLWIVASLALRIYLHYFNNYSVTYGSLGAVIILLTWFYISGLMLLIGAEINSEIEAAAAEKRLTGKTPSPDTPATTAPTPAPAP